MTVDEPATDDNSELNSAAESARNASTDLPVVRERDESSVPNDALEPNALGTAEPMQNRGPTSSRVAECRQFHKTRSFSAVEETPDKKKTINSPGVGPNLPSKDVVLSRSEQLEIQLLQQRSPGHDDDFDPSLAQSPNQSQGDNACGSDASRPKGDHLIMQFDYFSDGQPMSLQHDSSNNKNSDRLSTGHFRKSGQDIAESESDGMQCGFDGGKKNRAMNSRPRLDTLSYPTYHPLIHFQNSFVFYHSSCAY